LEPHSILLVLFRVCLLFALLVLGRHAITALLLQLLAVLFHELLDFPALLNVAAHRVVHWTKCSSVITVGRLTGALVASGTSPPTRHDSSNCGGGSTSQRLVIAADLLLVVVVLAATSLGSSAHIGFGTLPRFWSRWGVIGMTLCGPGEMHGELL
jgi:hypothetical protein